MIIPLTNKTCANYGCKQKIDNPQQQGGFKAHRTKQGNYTTGYLCKKCSSESAPSTAQLTLYKQDNHYQNIVNNEIEHKREWQKLNELLKKEEAREERKERIANKLAKMPTWEQVLEGIDKKKRRKNK